MRIVSLLPSTTEIVYALGLGDQLVGVTHECDYPADALQKPKLTRSHIVAQAQGDETVAASIDRQVRASLHAGHSLYDIDAELLAQLQPDLILTQELCDVCAVSSGLLRATLTRLALSPQILSLEPTSLDAVYQTILDVGGATGTGERARVEVDQLRTRAAKLRKQTTGRPAPRTLVLEWTDPQWEAAIGRPVSPRSLAEHRFSAGRVNIRASSPGMRFDLPIRNALSSHLAVWISPQPAHRSMT